MYIFSAWRFTTFAFSKGFVVHNVLKGLDHSKFKLINSGFGSILENFYPSQLSEGHWGRGNLNVNSINLKENKMLNLKF